MSFLWVLVRRAWWCIPRRGRFRIGVIFGISRVFTQGETRLDRANTGLGRSVLARLCGYTETGAGGTLILFTDMYLLSAHGWNEKWSQNAQCMGQQMGEHLLGKTPYSRRNAEYIRHNADEFIVTAVRYGSQQYNFYV